MCVCACVRALAFVCVYLAQSHLLNTHAIILHLTLYILYAVCMHACLFSTSQETDGMDLCGPHIPMPCTVIDRNAFGVYAKNKTSVLPVRIVIALANNREQQRKQEAGFVLKQ